MALAYLPLAILIIFSTSNENGVSSSSDNSTSAKIPKQILNPKRRNDLVDEAFLEQKDILLSMLENKLKEVRDKKRKKTDRSESLKEINLDTNECKFLPSDVDVKLRASGIVGIGETDLQLKFGESGNNTLDLNATGISNVGKTNVKLGIGDGNIHIPGLQDLFHGASPFVRGKCENQNKLDSDKKNEEEKRELIPSDLINRRSLELPSGIGNESLSSTTDEPEQETHTTVDASQSIKDNVTDSVTTHKENVVV